MWGIDASHNWPRTLTSMISSLCRTRQSAKIFAFIVWVQLAQKFAPSCQHSASNRLRSLSKLNSTAIISHHVPSVKNVRNQARIKLRHRSKPSKDLQRFLRLHPLDRASRVHQNVQPTNRSSKTLNVLVISWWPFLRTTSFFNEDSVKSRSGTHRVFCFAVQIASVKLRISRKTPQSSRNSTQRSRTNWLPLTQSIWLDLTRITAAWNIQGIPSFTPDSICRFLLTPWNLITKSTL